MNKQIRFIIREYEIALQKVIGIRVANPDLIPHLDKIDQQVQWRFNERAGQHANDQQ